MKILITGATGMVGEGIMLVCLNSSLVTEVLSISRKPLLHQHAKLKELIVKDFTEIDQHIEKINNYNACFFCAGVSSIGETEESFTKKTFNFVVPFAEKLCTVNPELTFTYVSGKHTDSSENEKTMWARVKGRTENALANLPFKAVYNFRPGFMKPLKQQKNINLVYKIFNTCSPIFYIFFPNWICKMQEIGDAMINCVTKGYKKNILEVADIKIQAKNTIKL